MSEPVEKVRFNDETRKAIVRELAEEEGIIPDESKTFDNAEDAMAYLEGKANDDEHVGD